MIARTQEELAVEASKLNKLLAGLQVSQVWRHRPGELGVEFTNGTRLFVDLKPEGLEMSVT